MPMVAGDEGRREVERLRGDHMRVDHGVRATKQSPGRHFEFVTSLRS